MAASFQALPPPGPPQPGVIYPTTTSSTGQDRNTTSDHSSGSFGMVFVVLAVILVVSAIACVLGRFCTKKSHKSSSSSSHQPKSKAHKQGRGGNHNPSHGHNHMNHHHPHPTNHKGNHHGQKHGGGRPKDPDLEFGFRSKEGDIMLGFDPKTRMFPTSKVANHGEFRGDPSMGRGMDHNHGDPREFP